MQYKGTITGAEYDQPYRVARNFPRSLPDSGYRIPIPPGTYNVTLHFADLRYKNPGHRLFHVHIEGKNVLPNYEPNRNGHATVETEEIEVEVDDGILEIRFEEVKAEAMISALEIR